MNALWKVWHWLRGCRGYIDREIDPKGIEWVMMHCAECGKKSRIAKSAVQPLPDERPEHVEPIPFVRDRYFTK